MESKEQSKGISIYLLLMSFVLVCTSGFQVAGDKTLVIDSEQKYYDFIRNNERDYIHIKLEGGLINKNEGFNFKSDSIFDRINENVSLKSLTIRSCNLTCIPDKICDNLNLQSLDLSSNAIKSGKNRLSKLRKLQFIDLDYNQLSKFELLMVQFLNLKDLHTISLNNNNLSYIPDNICKIKNLYILSLASNHIKEIPDCLSDYMLFKLNVQDNELVSIPCAYGNKKHVGYSIQIGGNPKIDVENLPSCLKSLNGIEITR